MSIFLTFYIAPLKQTSVIADPIICMLMDIDPSDQVPTRWVESAWIRDAAFEANEEVLVVIITIHNFNYQQEIKMLNSESTFEFKFKVTLISEFKVVDSHNEERTMTKWSICTGVTLPDLSACPFFRCEQLKTRLTLGSKC